MPDLKGELISAVVIPLARELFRVSDIEFEMIEGLEGEVLVKKVRRMRNPKVSGFLVLANTDTIAKLTNAVMRNVKHPRR